MTTQRSAAEFDRQYAAATRRGLNRRQNQPLAASARYDAGRGLVIELDNGCQVCMPLRLFPELEDASPTDLNRVEIMGVGQAIAWPTLDQQFDVLQLLADGIGAKALTAKRGQCETPAKSKAAGSQADGRGGKPKRKGRHRASA